jgi:hypothetical protein
VLKKSYRPPLVLLLLIVAAFVGDRVGGAILERIILLSEFRFAQLYRGDGDAATVIAGNSRSVHSFYAPDLAAETCRSVLHLGYNGMTAQSVGIVLEDYIARNRPPRVIVLEASTLFADSDFLPALSPFMGLSADLRAAIRARATTPVPIYDISHLFRFNSELLLRSLYYLGRSDQTWINRGRELDAALVESFDYGWLADREIDETTMAAVTSLVATARAHDIELLLVLAPYYERVLSDPGSGAFLDEFRDWALARFPDVTFVDLSGLALPRAAFADPIHLNIDGARVVTERLLERLPRLSAC